MKNSLCVFALLAASGTAMADFTTVNYREGVGESYNGERQHAQIISYFFGGGSSFLDGSFVRAGNDIIGVGANAGKTFRRVNDFVSGGGVGSPLDLQEGGLGVTDQVWQDGQVMVNADAKYAGLAQALGYKVGASGGTFTPMFDVTGVAANGVVTAVTGTTAFTVAPESDFRFARRTNLASPTNERSSLASENNLGYDAFVTYEILGVYTDRRAYMVFIEDILDLGSDFDYNDLVIEVSVVPLPPAAWAGIASLAGVGAFGYVRRRRNQR